MPAKRHTSLRPQPKSKKSHKTAKRLAVKKTMLAKKAAGKKGNVSKNKK